MNQRKSYHTFVKICYALGIENDWLPKEVTNDISNSTTHYWKKDDPSRFIGHDHADTISKNLSEIKLIYKDSLQREKQLFMAYARFKISIINMMGKDGFKELLKSNKLATVRLIDRLSSSFETSIAKTCKHLDIKPNVYLYWKNIATTHCTAAFSSICLTRTPTQATSEEIRTIKRFLQNKNYKYWPIASIWAYAIKNEKTTLSKSTWFRVNKKYRFRTSRNLKKYKPKYTPLRATKVNEVWHADVTLHKTEDNQTHYIYTIMDNYSRKVLYWTVHDKMSANIRLMTLRKTIQKEFFNIENASIDLIVDGGTENINHTIKDFTKHCEVNVHMKIALRDIVQSNSMIEAQNKTLKYSYLHTQRIADGPALVQTVDDAMYDYNNIRPHYIHGIHTPDEIHSNNLSKMDVSEYLKNAIKERIKTNKSSPCSLQCIK